MQTAKGECGPKSMGQNGAETHLRTIRVPMDLHRNKCLITRGTRDTGGNEPVILPRPAKTKGIHPLRVRIPETRKESG